MDADVFEGKLFNYLVALHLIGWITQFVGHGIFESKYSTIFNQKFSFRESTSIGLKPRFHFYRAILRSF